MLVSSQPVTGENKTEQRRKRSHTCQQHQSPHHGSRSSGRIELRLHHRCAAPASNGNGPDIKTASKSTPQASRFCQDGRTLCRRETIRYRADHCSPLNLPAWTAVLTTAPHQPPFVARLLAAPHVSSVLRQSAKSSTLCSIASHFSPMRHHATS
jgi:hypothetical protein